MLLSRYWARSNVDSHLRKGTACRARLAVRIPRRYGAYGVDTEVAGAGFAAPRTTRNPMYSGAGVQFDFGSAGQSALPPITLPLPSRVSTHSATLPPKS